MAVLPAEVRAAIVEDLRAEKSQNATARRHRVSPATVNAIAKAESIPANIRAPKNAAEARRRFNLEGRLDLSERLFAEIVAELDRKRRRVSLRELALTYAILVDKRRLEEGQATERHEYTDDDREFIERRMDELAARRREKALAGGADAAAS